MLNYGFYNMNFMDGMREFPVTIIEEVCEDICEHYCEYRNTIDSYGECDMQRESGKCPLDRLN